MKDVQLPLRIAYGDALAALQYEGAYLRVYDTILSNKAIANESEFVYVMLKEQTDNDDPRQKDRMMYEVTFLINIFYGSKTSGGKRKHDEVADIIFQSLHPGTNTALNLSSSSLQIVTTSKISDVTNFFSTNSHKVWVRSIRFRHIISEN